MKKVIIAMALVLFSGFLFGGASAGAVTSQNPTQAEIITTNTGIFTWIINTGAFTFVNGNISITRPNTGWADFSVNTYNAGYIIVTGAVSGTPVITSNNVTIPIATAGASQAMTVRYGGGDPAALAKRSTYGVNQVFDLRGMTTGAISAIVTPLPTTTVGIVYNVYVATPTIGLTPYSVKGKSYSFNINRISNVSDCQVLDKTVAITDLPKGSTSFTREFGVGSHSVTAIVRWLDLDNSDSTHPAVYRTNTCTAYAFNTIGNFKGKDSLAQLNAAGFLNKEYSGAVTVVAAGIRVTSYAQDMLMFPVSICGTLTGNYLLDYDTNPSITTASRVSSGQGSNLATGCTEIPQVGGVFYLTAGVYQKISCTVGASDTAKYIMYNSCKVSDWAKIEGGF